MEIVRAVRPALETEVSELPAALDCPGKEQQYRYFTGKALVRLTPAASAASQGVSCLFRKQQDSLPSLGDPGLGHCLL